jgi:predicted transcriptional regulator
MQAFSVLTDMTKQEDDHSDEPREARALSSEYSDLDRLIQQRMRSRKGRKIRSRSTILMEILEACRSPAVEHWIMIKARVGYEAFCKYTDNLIKQGKMVLLKMDDQGGPRKSKTYYSLTEEGIRMLEELKSEKD